MAKLSRSIWWLGVGLLPYAALPALSAPRVQKVDFTRDVFPILKARCVSCHAKDDPAGDLDLSTPKGISAGGRSGKLFNLTNARKSLFLVRVHADDKKPRMPMGFAPLSDSNLKTLELWIAQGAKTTETANVTHWAYVAPVRPVMPMPGSANPIDILVRAKLSEKGLEFSGAASKDILARRVFLDLTGLPPTVGELDAYLADTRPDAYEKLVDTLLASPHYGERQARPWLDLARYADTNGYEKDQKRSIWPYRDWVINAFNENMKFDQFTIEQIAGDLLPNATVAQKVATGLHRNTMLNTEGGVDPDEARWLTLVDRVGTTSSIWLGSTLACAQCHDHKYDPFKQKDFYRMLAYWEPTKEPTVELPDEAVTQKRAIMAQEMAEWARKAKDSVAPEADRKKAEAQVKKLKKEIESVLGATTLVIEEKKGAGVPQTNLRVKGAYLSKGELVTSGTPWILPASSSSQPRNRLGLAQWLVSARNPLTARVTMNRVWEQYFGRGIVETVEDFGTQGSRPSHPELLDWLAVEFMNQGWDLKKMHKLVVMSRTYQQSSVISTKAKEIDPQNVYLSHMPRFRMEAEMIRDTALTASGLLSRKVGGPSVMPYQPAGIWDSPYSGETWNPSQTSDAFRRGLYTFWKRTSPYPSFIAMDATSREQCTVRRIRTNTPLQALALLNDEAYFVAARKLAAEMKLKGGVVPGIQHGFRACTSRRPSGQEIDRLQKLYRELVLKYTKDVKGAQALGGDANNAAMTLIANVLLNLDETITKG